MTSRTGFSPTSVAIHAIMPMFVAMAGFDPGMYVTFGCAFFSAAVACDVIRPKIDVPLGESPENTMLPASSVPT